MTAQEAFWNQPGSCCAYQASGVGQRLGLVVEGEGGQVPPGRVAARELHDAREQNMSRKRSHQRGSGPGGADRSRRARAPSVHGTRKTATSVHSRRRLSHWKSKKIWPAETSDR
jgi:hypothetical protein